MKQDAARREPRGILSNILIGSIAIMVRLERAFDPGTPIGGLLGAELAELDAELLKVERGHLSSRCLGST